MKPEDGVEGEVIDPSIGQKKARKRRPMRKKSQLEDNYPNYLQEAFFGKGLLDKSKVKPGVHDVLSDEEKMPNASSPAKSNLEKADVFTFQLSPKQPEQDSDKEHMRELNYSCSFPCDSMVLQSGPYGCWLTIAGPLWVLDSGSSV